MRIMLGAGAALLLCASQAGAATYILSGTATVDYVAQRDNNQLTAYDPTGLISRGDAIQWSMAFDTHGAKVASLFDADPTINIYDFVGPLTLNVTMGQYSYQQSTVRPISASVQIWNDRNCCGSPTDNQTFSAFDYPIGTNKALYPFAIGSGSISESFTFNNFDYSASLLGSDRLSGIVDTAKFGVNLFSYGLLNADTNRFFYVSGTNVSTSLVRAVPEPSTWAMLILGFGAVGAAIRQRVSARREVRANWH